MTRPALLLAAIAVSATALTSGPARAGDPAGVWLNEDGDSKIKISQCGGAICGNIFWLKHPNDDGGKPKVDRNNADASKRGRPIMGVPIVLSMKPDGADKWSGQVYNAEDGKTYSGSFSLDGANKAVLKGCVAIICKSKTWTRSN
jgi:uncharacterized protein (DUF2147 family)